MTSHVNREHATWSASAAKGNMACPGRLALTANLPDQTSRAADWGTVCHEVAQACLESGIDADRFVGDARKGKKFEFVFDDEMAGCTQEYVDYVRSAAPQEGAGELWLEQRFSLAALKPPFDAGGTGDAVIYLPSGRRLEVVDLKTGRGVLVDARNNPQLRTYGLGALLAHPDLAVDTVKVTVVQPRAPHPDGRVRSEVFHVADLLDWTADMLAAMHKAADAVDARARVAGPAGEEEWAREWLRPGDHCDDTFCSARAVCPALRMRVEAAIGLHFSPVDDAPVLANAPESGSPEERARRLDMLDMIEGWVTAVRAHEHRLAELGNPAPGYGLVDKQGREMWGSEAEARRVLSNMPEDLYLNPRKMRTPKQVRDALKKAGAVVPGLTGLSVTSKAGTNLVRLDTTSRPAVSPVREHFTPVE